MNSQDFAAGVVANALKTKSTAYYWRGGNSTLVWLITTLLPHTFPVRNFANHYGDLQEFHTDGF